MYTYANLSQYCGTREISFPDAVCQINGHLWLVLIHSVQNLLAASPPFVWFIPSQNPVSCAISF